MIHDSALEAEVSSLVVETSIEYIGRWNRLVSTTNWEKGRIIVQWREALEQARAPVAGYTDEAWAEQVGGVTPQHVGRLRRVYERFADVCQQYPGLYWSHFYTALDWPDAEMWLEGAVQNAWSISQMRNQRCEALGVPGEPKPGEAENFSTEPDEDDEPEGNRSLPESITETLGVVRDAGASAKHLSETASFDGGSGKALDSAVFSAESAAPFRPFENLPPMPADLNEAFEMFKLAVISHKLGGWRDIGLEDVLAILDALKQLARAPAE
ncbi:MAG: hypothetical protein ABSE63_03520 [Thermoguttaceae bacterium]|jgi:hypothetical protein